MGIVLISTLTTTFLNIFSNAMSARALWPRASERALIVAGGALGTALALGVDGLLYEPFLLFIGSAFCPLFGLVLADYFLRRRGRLDAEALFRPDGFRYWNGINPVAMLVWVIGFALYQAASRLGWPCGAALPALAAAGLLYLILMRSARWSTSAP
jgi:purine-cytosine permease-like protein